MRPGRAAAALLLGLAALAAGAAEPARIVLRWKEVPGASAYELQVARDPDFRELVLQTRTPTAAYRWAQLPAETHWWRVRSVDAEGRPSEWSAARTVAVDAVVPAVLRPAAGATLPCGAPVEVELAASVLVSSYVLEVAPGADFAAPRELRQAEPLFRLGGLAPGTWYLRASAVDLRGRLAGPGPTTAVTVRVTAPRPRPPPEVQVGTPQVLLSWGEVACARSYLVEAISEARERVTMPASEASLPVMPKLAGDYRFRVAGVDEAGTSGEWSPELVLRVRLPAPALRPAVLTEVAELSWAPVPTAAGYRLELAHLDAPEDGVAVAVAGPPWRSAPLSPGTYLWRVQARDAAGHLSPFSEPRTFEVRPPASLAVPAVEPPDPVVAAGGRLDLAWSPVPEATEYQVEVDGALLLTVPGPRLRTPTLAEGWHALRVRALRPPLRQSAWTAPLEVYAGVPPVAEVALEQDGTELLVRLLDRRGLPVAGAAPRFSTLVGGLSAPEQDGGRWRLRWQPPAVGEDALVVEERGFRAERPLRPESLAPGWLSAQVGAIANGGAVASVSPALGVGWRLPFLQRRVGLELKGSLALASGVLTLGAGSTVQGSAVLVPVALLVQWQQPVGRFVLRGAVGPSLLVAAVRVNQASEVDLAPGLELAISGALALGPGRLELELAYDAARLDTALARLDAGGVSLRVGYAIDLGSR